MDNFRVIHIFNQVYYTIKAIPFTYYLTSYTKFFTSYWKFKSLYSTIFHFFLGYWIFLNKLFFIFSQFHTKCLNSPYCIYIPLIPFWPIQCSPSILDCIDTPHHIKSVLLPHLIIQKILLKVLMQFIFIMRYSFQISCIPPSWWIYT